MADEALSFLISVGIKKGRANIKKHKFRFPDGINDLAQFADELVELSQEILIHSVKQLWHKSIFSGEAVMTGSLVSSSVHSSSK